MINKALAFKLRCLRKICKFLYLFKRFACLLCLNNVLVGNKQNRLYSDLAFVCKNF